MPHAVAHRSGLWVLTFILVPVILACTRGEEPAAAPGELDVLAASIPELQAAMDAGALSSRDLVAFYLERIEAYDRRGPAINAVLTLNTDVLATAEALDAERRERGPRGPLHGIPVIVKDNFQTTDMPTTAGSRSLAGWVPTEDATLVRRLREAGAVILGKSNMHEFAWSVETVSSLGGQTRNPYAPDRNPGGSSGGTSAAVAAGFATAGLGTDTCGSIRVPAAHTALVGLRPTQGLSSRAGVIPLSSSHDTTGPIARSVLDLALLLDATMGPDPADAQTALAAGRVPESYAAALRPDALRGARVGVVADLFDAAPAEAADVSAVVRAAVAAMEAQGATAVPISLPGILDHARSAYVNRDEFKFDLNDYLAAHPTAPVRSLAEVIASGRYHPAVEDILQASEALRTKETPAYRARLARRAEVRATLEGVMERDGLDALVYPTVRRPAAPIGDWQAGYNTCLLASAAGLPALSVPAGYTADGLPVGIEMLGRAWSEPRLLALGYAFEQARRHRRPPESTPPLAR